ncbi:MAG: hypothetical protein O2904_02080 [bacterium]|nr:hypothetical protein [bacterium]
MSEIPQPQQALSLDTLPEKSRAALMKAVIDTLDLQEEGMGALPTLRAGIREVAAQQKLGEVVTILENDTAFENREDFESLRDLLRQEVILFDFERQYAAEMTPEEESSVMRFLKRNKVAIAVVLVALATGGIVAGLHSAGIITLTRLPFTEPVQAFFASASDTVQEWWGSLQSWWAGGGDVAATDAAKSEAGQLAEEAVSDAQRAYDGDIVSEAPLSPSPSDKFYDSSGGINADPPAKLDNGTDPFSLDDGSK